MKRCLIIFAKEPEKGRVKTRLQKLFSKEHSLNLYKAFLKDIIELTKRVTCEMKIIAYTSRNKNPIFLKQIAPSFIFYKQKGKDLGQRMHSAFKYARNKGAAKTVIIGSDSPNLPVRFINDAFRKLSSYDAVLGPSYDGGYYLIGLNRPCPSIFKSIEWSSERVLDQTVKQIDKLCKKTAMLKKWFDVDSKNDLIRLKKDLERKNSKNVPKWTKEFLLDK